MTKIVAVEQPIHAEEVGRRFAACCGWKQAGRVIQQYALQGLKIAKRNGTLHQEGDFWFLDDDEAVEARDRSDVAATEPVRRIALVSAVEIAAAAIHALEESLAMLPGDLVVETARLMGFARVGKDINGAVRDVIDAGIGTTFEMDHLGRLRLAVDTED